MAHAHVTIRADLTWTMVSVAVHWQTEDEHGEATATGGVRATCLLEEVPAIGAEPEAVLHELGRELLALAATMRESDRQGEV